MSLSEKEQAAYSFLSSNPVGSKLGDLYNYFSERREALGLSNPGTVDNVAKEVQRDVFLNNQTFTGLRADLTKTFSASPLFQISHALSMGSQALPPYNYAALYGSPKVFLHATLDSDWGLSARFNYRWSSALISKTSVQLAGPGQAMFSIDNDYNGADFSASLKAMNPSILEGSLTGIFVGSYLQAITPRLALGLEGVWQRQAGGYGPDCLISYAGRYKGSDWVASGQLLAGGQGMQASYWRRLTEKVETGVDLNLSFAGLSGAGMMGGGMKQEGVTTLGVKYDFQTQSSFRAQVDSQGKIGCLLEKRVAPPVQITFAGEIDQFKNTCKVGLAVSIEGMSEEVMEQTQNATEGSPPPF
ncbi:hypothetical protein K402DRAFT_339041 [Aulographum hederae CBS 113979]|uniref:Mitochondrial import receptor subunit tom-40 n=1 Tax=Aulographum hederae CBS 113979 TaxID=1176131 RepID=A0A6G1GQX5_9PEZI|nr:hypothetical protein K402DRAFT_339041 [Aulographum hederae CBS 113979]